MNTEEFDAFERCPCSLEVIDTIRDLRRQVDGVRQRELARTTRLLSSSLSESELADIEELTTRLVNRLLHGPMLRLKESAANGHSQMYVQALRYLFDLKEGEKIAPTVSEYLLIWNAEELSTNEEGADILYG